MQGTVFLDKFIITLYKGQNAELEIIVLSNPFYFLEALKCLNYFQHNVQAATIPYNINNSVCKQQNVSPLI